MKEYRLERAKDYIQGTNGVAKIGLMEDTADVTKGLLTRLQERCGSLTRDITGNGLHNATRYSQLPCLQAHLKKINFAEHYAAISRRMSDQREQFEQKETGLTLIQNALTELVLFVKYEAEKPGKNLPYIEPLLQFLILQLGLSNLRFLLQELGKVESLSFFNIIDEYLSLQSLEIVRTRYLHNGFVVGRNDGYQDRADGEEVTIRNPETLLDETYIVQNICCSLDVETKDAETKDTESKGQEMSLLGKIYTPVTKSPHPMVYVSWRGSQNKESWFSDAQVTPGFESFLHHEQEIIAQISKAIASVSEAQGRPVHVMISGHSLGGALSQVTYHAIQGALCRGRGNKALSAAYNRRLESELKGRYDYLPQHRAMIDADPNCSIDPAQVARMHLVIFNSPGVLESVQQSSNECSKYLSLLAKPVGQYADISMTQGDLVQKCGPTTILTDLETNGATMSLFYNNNGQVGQAAKAGLLITGPFNAAALGSLLIPGACIPAGIIGTVVCAGAVIHALSKSHTEKFIDEEEGLLNALSSIQTLDYVSSKSGSAAIQKIRGFLLDKNWLMTSAAMVASSLVDLLSKRRQQDARYAKAKTAQETKEAAEEKPATAPPKPAPTTTMPSTAATIEAEPIPDSDRTNTPRWHGCHPGPMFE